MDADPGSERLNVLLAISDDQSWIHTSVEGSPFVHMPNMDRLASGGYLFTEGYAASPGCSPSRAALLTGQHHWMIGPAGTHGSSFPAYHETFVDLLEADGYKVGFTGKGWGPGSWSAGGRDKNPAGVEYNQVKLDKKPKKGISDKDYAGNFEQFLAEREEGEPFFFWYGGHEPHLSYAEGLQSDDELAKVKVPAFLPDTEVSRSTLLDYADEIHHFDDHLGRIIALLDEAGELDNTLIIVTSDNGMPMPRAKATGYEYGIHVPLVARWGEAAQEGKVVTEPVGFVDLSATIVEAAGLEVPEQFVGTSLAGMLKGENLELKPDRAVFAGRERQSASRYQNLSYPQRMMRRGEFLVIWSAKPDRAPAGQGQEILDGTLGEPHSAYYDIGPSAIKRELLAKRDDPYFSPFFHLAVDKRPEWQLFNVIEDPDCLNDLSDSPQHASVFTEYQQQLTETLRATGDPRVLGYGQVWEDYPRIQGSMRYFPKPENEVDTE
ncbi:MAG: sulfatase [Gammaproteobacteria bacterium]|nr:sulfatase [Gammaproteobacteria bacterium]NNJ80390.1 sulfatase [Xanthomonadales bacterium]